MRRLWYLIVTAVILISASSFGCIEEQEESQTVTIPTNNTITMPSNNQCIKSDQVQTEIALLYDISGTRAKTITGRVIEIRIQQRSPDVIVFQDGYVFAIHDAEYYIWKLGEVHRITWVEDNFLGRRLRNVEILN